MLPSRVVNMIREPRLSILRVLALIALLGLVQKFELQPSPNKVELLENRNFTMKRVSDIQSVQLLLHDTALIHEKKFQGLVRPPDYLGASCHHLTTYWECRDCGEDGLFQDWEQCPIMLSQRGGCDFEIAVKAKDEDSKAVFSSFYEFEHAERNRLKHFGLAHDFEQMPCGAIEDCVTLQKCTNGLTLYVYEESGRAYIQALLASTIQNVTIVTEPEQACLLLVSCDGLNPPQDLTENFKWNGGRNHLIWQAHRCWPEQNHPDRPFPTSWNYGMAAIASASLMYTNLRRHYDVSLPLFTNPDYIFTISKAELVKSSSSNSRPLLLVLKCNMYDWEQVWWQYRWLAYKYWAKASDVIVDAKCPEKGKTTYDEDYPYNYTQLLLNSKFAFCREAGPYLRIALPRPLGWVPSQCSHLKYQIHLT